MFHNGNVCDRPIAEYHIPYAVYAKNWMLLWVQVSDTEG